MKNKSPHSCQWLFVLFIGAVLSGCINKLIGASLDPCTIGNEFNFIGQNLCNSGSSPAHMLSNLPEGTVKLKVTMCDLDQSIADHGGGTLENFTGTSLPEGAMKQYSGPWLPMSDHRRCEYGMKMVANDVKGIELAFGQKMKFSDGLILNNII